MTYFFHTHHTGSFGIILQVAPAELESLLLSHPDVKDTGVVGVSHSTWGEVPLAWVVLKPDRHASEEELADFVNS